MQIIIIINFFFQYVKLFFHFDYDLLDDGYDAHIIDIFSLLYKMDKFHVTVYLFRDRSKMVSKMW